MNKSSSPMLPYFLPPASSVGYIFFCLYFVIRKFLFSHLLFYKLLHKNFRLSCLIKKSYNLSFIILCYNILKQLPNSLYMLLSQQYSASILLYSFRCLYGFYYQVVLTPPLQALHILYFSLLPGCANCIQ